MSLSADEYRELLTFFSANTSAPHVISLALKQLSGNESQADADADALITLTNAYNDNDSENFTSNVEYKNLSAGRVVPRISSDIPIWLIPCYSIIFFFAIVGNLLVISTLAQHRRMRTITNLFLLNLAISDILLGVLCMPVTLVGTLLRHFIFSEFLCKLIQFSQAASVAVSSWTLVAISCERYYAICHPLRSRTWQTINHAYRIIGFIWFGSMVCMTPIAIFSQLMPTSRQGLRKCREHWPSDTIVFERSYNIFLDLVLLVLPLCILCVAYILITRTLYVGMRNERALIFGGSSSASSKASTQMEAVATVTTNLVPPPTTAFNLNMSFRCHKRNGAGVNAPGGNALGIECHAAKVGNHHNGAGSGDDTPSDMEASYQQQQKQQQQQHQYHQQPPPHCYADEQSTLAADGKRKLLMPADGRRHLYCVRSASFKSLQQHNNNDNSHNNSSSSGNSSPTLCLTVLHASQQQRFKLHQHHQQQQHQQQQKATLQQRTSLRSYPPTQADRRKSNSTPSLRINDAALRRSNESKTLESKRRVVKMLFVLVLEFFICWTPLYVINTLTMFIGAAIYEYIDYTSISFLQLLAYSSSCCNPITYCFMNASFRRAFLDTFKGLPLGGGRFWRKRSKADTQLSMADNSIIKANHSAIMTNNATLDSPRI